MKRLLALSAVLLVAVAAADEHEAIPAFDGGFIDIEGDADAVHDILAVRWNGADGHIQVELADALDPDAGLTVVLYTGSPSGSRPDDAYILHTGPGGTQALTVREGGPPSLDVHSNGTMVEFTTDAWSADCAFAVAQVVTYPEGGQEIEDRIGAEDIGDAWNGGDSCSQDLTGAIDDAEDEEAPTPGAVWLVGTVGVLVVLRRMRGA